MSSSSSGSPGDDPVDNANQDPSAGTDPTSDSSAAVAVAAAAAAAAVSAASSSTSNANALAAAAASLLGHMDSSSASTSSSGAAAAASASTAAGAGASASSAGLPVLSGAAAAAAAMFSEDLDESDMTRLQAMLEARGFPPHLANVLGPRMHHLILNRAMAPSATSRAQQLLQGIQATGDESRQLQAVIEMCQLLVMGNEDTLTGFPIRQVVPALITLLKMEHNFDLMNHACRALTYMMEALPRSTSVIVDAIPTFLEKLQSIQCMDVAEQSLSALEMLSKKHHKSILHAKGVMACLMYLDFFSITAQRNALAIAANCCQALTPEEFIHVQDALAVLSSRLIHGDKRSSESACLALSRLAESFKNDKNRLRDLAKVDVLTNLQSILVSSPPGSISSNTFVTVLHILVVMSSHGSEVGPMLLEESISATLKQLLVGISGPSASSSPSPSSSAATTFPPASSGEDCIELVQRNPQELYEITSLIAELMPPLPADGIFAVDALLARPGAYIRDPVLWQWQDDKANWHTYGYNDCRIIEAAFVAGEDEAVLTATGSSNQTKSFKLNLKSMHEIREESGTARPIQRKLTSQLQVKNEASSSEKMHVDETAAEIVDVHTLAIDKQAETENEEKVAKRLRHLELTAQLTRELMPILLEVYSTSAGPGVRHSCIQAFLRMAYHSTCELLSEVLRVPAVSSQIAGMLASGDLRIVVGALQLSELLLQRMPEEFGVHFRREGVLHQVQKLTDPDHPICLSQTCESPGLASTGSVAWSTSGSNQLMMGSGVSGRSWTVAGTSFANMFPDQLRVAKRREESSSSPDAAAGSSAQGSSAGVASTSGGAQAPLRLSDMLKRKRVSKRTSGRKGRHSEGSVPHDLSTPGTSGASTSAPSSASVPSSATVSVSAPSAFDMSSYSAATQDPQAQHSGGTPSRRSRIADRTSTFFSQLHPSRWVRSSGGSGSSNPTDGSSSRKELSAAAAAAAATQKALANPVAMAHSREKAKRWVREQATRFMESYFKESLGSRHPALTILRRLSAQVDHLSRKPKNGETSLKGIMSLLLENDVSPFEVTQSGLVPTLLSYLTKQSLDGQDEVSRDIRVRTFLHVFLGCPKTAESEDDDGEASTKIDADAPARFLAFVQKMNACVNHLEQFPIKMHDVAGSGGPGGGVRSASSTLRFFKTHHLKCSLQRHPDCTSLKSWKGGLVKIDPLALVQAIERYLISRGYGHPQDRDSGSDDDMSDDGTDDMLPSTSSGSGSNRGSSDSSAHRLEFYIGDNLLPYDMTVYQAVQQFGTTVPSSMSGGFDISDSDSDSRSALAATSSIYGSPGVWAKIHQIYYRPASERISASNASSESKSKSDGKKGKGSKQSKRKAPDELWADGVVPERPSPLEQFLASELPKLRAACPGESGDPSLEVLCLLRCLHALNRYWGSLYPSMGYYGTVIPTGEFMNAKLTAKVNRQLQDPIIIMTSNLPAWLREVAIACPFLFPFETRQLLFYVTSFDRDRALLRLLDSVPELGATDSGQERVTPDLDRKKRIISRENLIKQAETILSELAHSRSLLEIQYENEVGTGLGPTLEFYTLVSKDLQRSDLSLWKGDAVKISSEDVMDSDEDAEDCIEYVHSATGLYPVPLARNAKSSQRNRLKLKFNFIGKFLAKAVLDNRMVDLPFSRPFYQWLLREEHTFSIQDLLNIDPTIANTVSQLEGIVRKKRRLEENDKITTSERSIRMKTLTMDGCPVEDLGLDFTLPGYPGVELRKGGRDTVVTLDNLDQYVRLVSHWLLVEGVSCQMESLREGFESVFSLSSLQMFYPDELDQIFCGYQQQFARWDARQLLEACKPDHGYNQDSKALQFLFEVMSSYGKEEQREFLQFVTGCPRLPVGGFKALSPPLTIVKKTFDSPDVDPNDYLPSVMTCVNYLKLPDYSSVDIMREKLRVASREGQYCFHLS